ncbi:MAG: FKBP-type peptidyl-prolyl cis-trans isomerase [Streptosporangiaceae bacterium]|jgi:peptidylprolyl isomerase
MRRIAAALAVPLLAVLALAGCGSSTTPATNHGGSVKVSGAFGAAPTVTIPAAEATGKLAIKTVIQGNGPVLTSGDSFVGNYAVYIWSGSTHKLALTTFAHGSAQETPQVLAANVGLTGLKEALTGKRMGSRVLAVLPPKYAYGSKGNSQIGVKPTDTIVFVVDLIKDYSGTASASGKHVSNGGGGLPTVTASPGSAPQVKIPSTKPPRKLIVKTLIRGTGPRTAKGQTIVTQYVGLNWRTGKVFDSSWQRKEPFGFTLDATPAQIIPGWDTGLLGVPVGSRVMLIIPPADGYGKTGNTEAGIKGTDTLVFVIDVIGAVSN